MNELPSGGRRIVITLDSAPVDAADFERLTHLARRLGAELEGVFVEDSDLLRLPEMTFLKEFRPTSQRAETFQPRRLRQELRVLARRAERTLGKHAERQGVKWRFRTWRGSLERELLSGVEADVLAIMRLGAVELQPTRRRAADQVAVCYDGSEGSARGLATAADLAAENPAISLQVLLPAAPEFENLRGQAAGLLSTHPGKVMYRRLDDNTATALLAALAECGASALVMQRANPLLRTTPLRAYLSRLRCPLFLVR